MRFITLGKRTNVTSADVLHLLLHLFFYFRLCSFVDGGTKIFFAQGQRVP